MFKVNNKDTKTTPLANDVTGVVLVSLLLTYFTPCSSISIVNFEHIITGWVVTSISRFPIPGWETFKSIFFRCLKAEQCNFLEPLIKEHNKKNKVMTENKRTELTQPEFTCPKSTMEIAEQCRKSAQSQH